MTIVDGISHRWMRDKSQIMYEGSTVQADDTGITINKYQVTGATKRILYDDIGSATTCAARSSTATLWCRPWMDRKYQSD